MVTDYAICIIGLILYVVILFNVFCSICSANERILTSSSDVETLPVLLQANTENNPNTTHSQSVTYQIPEDEVDQIQIKHLDDNNNSAFPVTIPLRNGTCYEPVFKDYFGKTPYWYRSSFHNLMDIYNV